MDIKKANQNNSLIKGSQEVDFSKLNLKKSPIFNQSNLQTQVLHDPYIQLQKNISKCPTKNNSQSFEVKKDDKKSQLKSINKNDQLINNESNSK